MQGTPYWLFHLKKTCGGENGILLNVFGWVCFFVFVFFKAGKTKNTSKYIELTFAQKYMHLCMIEKIHPYQKWQNIFYICPL